VRRTPVLIIGGGPAGAAAAAVLARAGAPHLLIERTAQTGDALCGGFLSWQTLRSLALLGVDPARLNPADTTHVRLFHNNCTAQARLPRPAKAVSRRRLDGVMLAQAEQLGARIERGVWAKALRNGHVRLDDGAEIIAESVFLATGKRDLRGAPRPAARSTDPVLGLRMRLAPSSRLTALVGTAVELHLVERGYAGLVLQEDGSANLCLAICRSRLEEAGTPAALLAALARECPPLGERLGHWVPPLPGGATDALATIDAVANIAYGWRARTGTAGLFRLGDQAGVIPSLAGEGMGIAITSGIRAALAWQRSGPGGAIGYQRALAASLARPMALAGLISAAAFSANGATWLLKMAQSAPFLFNIAARLTRINHSRIDALPVCDNN
jgi:flavin-dependent dehydrogenase